MSMEQWKWQVVPPTQRKLRIKAPRRCWNSTANGTWTSVPWGKWARTAYEQAGGWFGTAADHDFT